MGESDEIVVVGELELSDDEPKGKWRNFDEMTREERQEMARRSHDIRRRKREARALAQLEVYTQAHRELASQILGTKMVLLDGLVDEMLDPETGQLNTRLLDKDRMKLLMQLMEQLQKTAFPATTKVEHSGSVDMRHMVAQISKQLDKPDDV